MKMYMKMNISHMLKKNKNNNNNKNRKKTVKTYQS